MAAEDSSQRVAHLDADAFYVSIELTRRPELRGLPVVVSGTGPRAVVTTASYEARKYGVGSAMPASRARRLCPQAVFLPPDFTTYRAVSRKVMELVRAHVERVEVVGLDEAYLDLTELHSPNAAMRRLIAEIKRATQLTCSVGIGPNKLVAKVASDAEKPAGFVVLTREQACVRFAQSPPGLIPGIGPKTAARLAELGLETLAAVAAAPEEQLIARFGQNLGPQLQRRARFES
ncbi:MAG TPA: DNA polymerase IV, partial [Solirubrobacteraceae bacterium]